MTITATKTSAYPMTIRGRTFTRDEANQLLYLETRAVDHGGLCNGAQMNRDDVVISDGWHAEGFLYFRRVAAKQLHEANRNYHGAGGLTHMVVLTDEAHACAAELRYRRARRGVREEYIRREEWR